MAAKWLIISMTVISVPNESYTQCRIQEFSKEGVPFDVNWEVHCFRVAKYELEAGNRCFDLCLST